MTQFSDSESTKGFVTKLFVLVTALLVLAAGTAAFLIVHVFDRDLSPELDKKAAAIGRSVARQVAFAAEHGIPFEKLYGVEAFLDQVMRGNADIASIELADAAGRVRYAAGRKDTAAVDTDLLELPIDADGTNIGTVRVRISQAYLERELSGILYDVLIVLLVALLIAMELLLIVMAVSLFKPIEGISVVLERASYGDFRFRLPVDSHDEIGRLAEVYNSLARRLNEMFRQLVDDAEEVRLGQIDASIVRQVEGVVSRLTERFNFPQGKLLETFRPVSAHAVRAPLFVFIFAEEMSRPFLPIYIRELYTPIAGMSMQTAIGLPIAAFMLTIAVVTPIVGAVADRYGPRTMFLIGAVPSIIGYVGSAFAGGLFDLIGWRVLSGAGYAIVYLACQGYIAQNSLPESRAQGMAMFMGAVFAAGVCGPALGGILADQIGMRSTFVVSGGLCVAAALALIWLLPADAIEPEEGLRRVKLSDFRVVLTSPGFSALVVFIAIPNKVALTGFLFFLAPLFLDQLGNTSSETGRVMMIYGACTALLTPLAARFADSVRGHRHIVTVGCGLAGLGLLPILLQPSTALLVVGVLFFGIGHAMSIAPQLALVPESCPQACAELGHTTVLGVFRILERLGSVIGPFVASLLIGIGGPVVATAGMGALVLAGAILFGLYHLARPGSRAVVLEGRSP